jgi:uncharacterized protein (DUF2062 family)
MTDAEKQELVDRVMSFVWKAKDRKDSAEHLRVNWPAENLHIIWNPILKSLRFSVRVASAQAGIAFIDITVLKITVGTGQTWRREDLALDALQQLRQLMILDDLANV